MGYGIECKKIKSSFGKNKKINTGFDFIIINIAISRRIKCSLLFHINKELFYLRNKVSK